MFSTNALLLSMLSNLEKMSNDRKVRDDPGEMNRRREQVLNACELLVIQIKDARAWDPHPKVVKNHLVSGGIGFRVVE